MRLYTIAFFLAAALFRLDASEVLLYIGTYTNQGSKGIYISHFDDKSGTLSKPELAAETPNPTFLALHPSRRFLYAANEVGQFGSERSGFVSAFAIDQTTGKLTLLNQVSSKGGGPCHVSVDKTGKTCLVANYGGGTVAALGIGADGQLAASNSWHQHMGKGADPRRQERAHAHSINPSPGGHFAVAADLGTDTIYVYLLDAVQARLTPNAPEGAKAKPGAGPRHFSFHPDGKKGYVINELASTITAYLWNESKGLLTEIAAASTLPQDFKGSNYTAEVRVHPSGRFVYGSNRGHDSIAVFTLDGQGAPKLLQNISTGGEMPRNFTIDKSGKWLLAANQKTGNISVFSIDQKTGRLTDTGKRLELSAPVCLRFLE